MAVLETLNLAGEAGFEALFQHATVGIIAVGDDGHIILANPITEKLFGYTHAELTGQPVEILIPDALRLPHKHHRGKYMKNPKVRPMGQEMELSARHKDGTVFPVEISLGHYSQGDSTIAVAFITDITERRSTEERLEEEAEWLRFLNDAMNRLWNINSLEDGLKEILDTSIKLLQADRGNIRLLDHEKQVLTIAAQQGFDNEYLEHFKDISAENGSVCGDALSAGKQIVVDDVVKEPIFARHIRMVPKIGFRSVQSTPLYDKEGQPIAMVSVHADTTSHFTAQGLRRMELYARYAESFLHRMKTHETIANINLRLEEKVKERTNELADVLAREIEHSRVMSAFVSMVSHEFRTPLSIVLSSAGLIEKYTQTEHQDKRELHLQRITSSVRHLADLLDDFLALGKFEDGKVHIEQESFNLENVLHNIGAELDGVKKASQDIKITYKGTRKVQLDKKLLRNIMLNLLSNAIKYSDKDIYLDVDAKDRLVTLTLKDEGIGIPEVQQAEVFGKFFRANNVGSVRGTGLGLNIVKLYVDLLGGTIGFKSEENVGTTFTVTLPNMA